MNIGIIGLGLIGGSIAKAIKQQNYKLHKILKDAEYLTTMGFVSTMWGD